MVDIPTVKSFKGLVGDVLNLDTGSTFRQPHGTGRDTELVSFITDDPDHYCKECKTAICKNCGREMHKRDLELGQSMNKKNLHDLRSEVVGNMEPNEYEEFSSGRLEPLDKLDWFRKCKNSTTCEAYKNSNIRSSSYRIFSSGEVRQYTYYDNKSSNTPIYRRQDKDPQRLPLECKRCGTDIKGTTTHKNNHPFWGKICNDCADTLKDSSY